jgi:diguanylate cyclase (GGDEF)-like protein/PAS domain S-box-containing protein
MSKTIQTLIGIALLVMGGIVLLGWLLHVPLMVQFKIGFVPMQFNTGMCFVLTGIALALPGLTGKLFPRFQTVIGGILIILCGLTFGQILFDLNLGIDWPALHTWIGDGNIRPGRMAPNTALGFICIGSAFVLIPRVSTKQRSGCVQVLTFSILALGLTGLVGYMLGPDLLFGWASSARMAVHTASGMILVGVALWLSWTNAEWNRSKDYFGVDEKIAFLGAAILIVVALTAGLTGFVSQQYVLQKSLQHQLRKEFETRTRLFHKVVEEAVLNSDNTARRPDVVALIQHLINSDNEEVISDVEARETLLANKFLSIAIQGSAGKDLLRIGNFSQNAQFKVTLPTSTPSTLVWSNGLRLQTTTPVFDDFTRIGTLMLEHSLDSLQTQLFSTLELGKTGEVAICIDAQLSLMCLPRNLHMEIFRIKPFSKYGKPLPMKLALGGESGIIESLDYRGNNVVAAYGLLAPTLGMVNKQDAVELYTDIREQLKIVLPLLILLVTIGVILLRLQLKPLAQKLITSEAIAGEKEQQIRILLSSVSEGILTIDDGGIIQSFNPAAALIFDYSADQVLGKNIKMLMPSTMHESHDAGMHSYIEGGPAKVIGKNVELPGLRSDGSAFQLELSINEMYVNDRRLFVGIMRDITERKQAELELFEEKERLHVTLKSIGDAVITTDTLGLITYLNPVAEIMTGWSNREANGKTLPEVFRIIDEKTQEPALNPVKAVLESRATAGLAENTILVQRYSGAHFPIEDSAAPIRGKKGDIIGVVLVFHDVSQAKKMAAEMTYQATHDSLTGLINRREFERRVELALQTGKMQHKEHSLLYLDLDQFKIVNDTCGHIAGDQLLRQLTSALLLKLRQTDTLARLGGDEFGVLLDSCPTSAALKIAEVLRTTVNDFLFAWSDKSFSVGVSIGLVTFSNDGITLTDVLQMADSACYVAKEKGRNRVQVYLPEEQEFANRHGQMGWVARIKQALDENRFVLYSQQFYALNSTNAAACHHELLIRMRDEKGNLVPPMAFIPAAERYGLMPQIDRWVVSTAFSRSAILNRNPEQQQILAINLSGTTLCDENFLAFIHEQFEKYGVSPANFCFEITETAAIANLTQAIKLIQDLQSIGCLFALDDFGSGMSSFTYLKHLPVNFLKIDGSFVKDMIDNPIDRAMVESINHIGHVMNIQTIAEFVENDQVLHALRKIGVDFAQGYLIQKPQLFFEHSTRA